MKEKTSTIKNSELRKQLNKHLIQMEKRELKEQKYLKDQ